MVASCAMQRLRRWHGPATGIFFACAVLAATVSLVSAGATGCELAVPLDHFDDGCPPGRHGPTSVRITTSSSPAYDGGSATVPSVGAFCIDSTEVTNAQYQEFLDAGVPPASVLPTACADAGQSDFRPRDGMGNLVPFVPGQENFPVVQVNWCAAYAYCVWAGKRMCGQIGGGPLAEGNTETNPALGQWYDACSKGGSLAYPYGNTFNTMICGGGGGAVGSTIGPIEVRPGCVGGYPGIYDMSGSVWEWNDVCASSKPGDFCHVYGGAFDSMPAELACNSERNWTRTSTAANIGIRCCEDL
jgi:formylglycine-generating enzyme required for sulfatase activity